MLEKVKKLLKENVNRSSFFGVIGQYFPHGSDDYKLIERAYDTAKNAFRDKYRDDGETRYFEHLRGVALIVLVHMRVRDANVVAAALLHDIIEDIDGWDQQRIALEFNNTIAQLVWWVTKPDVADFDGDKEARNRAYHQKLRRAIRNALIIKLADRLHNLITLWTTPKAKQRRKVIETQDFYLPIAEEQILLVHEIEEAIRDVELSWNE